MKTNMNKLLALQISKHFGSTSNLPEELNGFIKDINDSYNDFGDDTKLIQNSIELSSQELRESFVQQKVHADNPSKSYCRSKF